jgi:putative flippase GtrA
METGRLNSGVSQEPPVLDIVVPVHNEEVALERCLRRLHTYLLSSIPYSFRITIAENGSTDSTAAVARRVAADLPGIHVVVLPRAGRGGALRTVWLASDAKVLVYMDVDLSTDLDALLPLVAPLISGHSDVAIGSRLSRSSRILRGPKREFLSRGYNLLLRGTGTTAVSDAQCGFKAIRADVAQCLLPLSEDDEWFFDTELLWLAKRAGLRVHEVPVDWVDDLDSRVHIGATVRADLAGIIRLRRGLLSGRLELATVRERIGRHPLPGAAVLDTRRQLAAFAVVGALSALTYLLLFLLLREVATDQEANLGAVLVSTLGNTSANRRWTFGGAHETGAGRAQLQGLAVASIGLAITGGALALLHHAVPAAPLVVEIGVLVIATAAATVVRFALFSRWIFRRDRPADRACAPAPAYPPRPPTRANRPTPDPVTARGATTLCDHIPGGPRVRTPPGVPSRWEEGSTPWRVSS